MDECLVDKGWMRLGWQKGKVFGNVEGVIVSEPVVCQFAMTGKGRGKTESRDPQTKITQIRQELT